MVQSPRKHELQYYDRYLSEVSIFTPQSRQLQCNCTHTTLRVAVRNRRWLHPPPPAYKYWDIFDAACRGKYGFIERSISIFALTDSKIDLVPIHLHPSRPKYTTTRSPRLLYLIRKEGILKSPHRWLLSPGFTHGSAIMANPGSLAARRGDPPIPNASTSKKNTPKDVFDEYADEFLDKSRYYDDDDDPIDSVLWEELLYFQAAGGSDEQVFDSTTEFVDRGKHDESGLCEDLLYGCLK